MECSSALTTLTYRTEGNDDPGSRYFSRRPHVPSDSSGVTLGRGYDLSSKTKQQITDDLLAAGFPLDSVHIAREASGLRGQTARTYLSRHPFPELTLRQQEILFCLSYNEAEKDVRRISAKDSVTGMYGAVNWAQLNPSILELLIDLRFRGDYTSTTRVVVQRSAANNDLETLAAVLAERSLWPNVPLNRFKARAALITNDRD